jgi:hypothetical protein
MGNMGTDGMFSSSYASLKSRGYLARFSVARFDDAPQLVLPASGLYFLLAYE